MIAINFPLFVRLSLGYRETFVVVVVVVVILYKRIRDLLAKLRGREFFL